MEKGPLTAGLINEGRVLRLTLARPKANILDQPMLSVLQEALDSHRDLPELCAVLIDAQGTNFSFGASVADHLPAQCANMLQTLHKLVLTLVSYPLPVLVAVRGQCLGGGLELACSGSMIIASPDAKFAQPEIKLGVFAPVASCLLPEKIGRSRAEDLLTSGRTIDAREAERIGLVNSLAEDPEQAAIDYITAELSGHSTFALRHAVWAAREDYADRVHSRLARLEQRYLDELMRGRDPEEGLTAFINKRAAIWHNR